MTSLQWMNEVHETIARFGHRDNGNFKAAAAQTNPCVVYSAFQVGVREYVPGTRLFDAYAAVDYALLLAKANSVTDWPKWVQRNARSGEYPPESAR
jgi:hypothetical protein